MVLIVADNAETVQQAVSSTLEKAGFAVAAAASGPGALDRCRQERLRPTLAVIDTTLPGIALHDFVSQLHQISPEVRVVFLSSDSPSEVVRSANAQWHGKLISKPFRRSQLLGQVLALMDEPLVLTA